MVEVVSDYDEVWGADIEWNGIAALAAIEAVLHSDFANFVWNDDIQISVRFSTDEEVQTLNAQWRNKDKATNVLSFPMLEVEELVQLSQLRHPELVSGSISPHNPKGEVDRWMLKQVQHDEAESEIMLGDLILAYGICKSEAEEKGVSLQDHTTHLIVHGTLHLLGYDHIKDAEAEHMEALEVKALASLGLPNPY